MAHYGCLMNQPQRIGVYFFSNDLRVHDNPILHRAANDVDQLLCVFCYQSWWDAHNKQQLVSLGQHRARFLLETLNDLNHALQQLGQTLVISDHSPAECLRQLEQHSNITHVYQSQNAGFYEQQQRQTLATLFDFEFIEVVTHTIFEQHQLPFDLAELPDTFSKFRKLIEKELRPNQPLIELRYKEVRNAIDGWDNSTKFSPWLANGSLSVRTLLARLHQYEQEIGQNGSTYWIYFELLWREYFQWYAHLYQQKLFSFRGIKQRNPLTSYYPERFKKWCSGNTPYPIVNACMTELNHTGYLSNRGRQIVASCLVNELKLDWRYGAAYFEQQLIDYDVASNWGNWQYLGGVGADPRETRHFNLDKQTEMFDLHGDYRAKWGAKENTAPLDSVDAADWPIT